MLNISRLRRLEGLHAGFVQLWTFSVNGLDCRGHELHLLWSINKHMGSFDMNEAEAR